MGTGRQGNYIYTCAVQRRQIKPVVEIMKPVELKTMRSCVAGLARAHARLRRPGSADTYGQEHGFRRCWLILQLTPTRMNAPCCPAGQLPGAWPARSNDQLMLRDAEVQLREERSQRHIRKEVQQNRSSHQAETFKVPISIEIPVIVRHIHNKYI
jgi:hypothetical protein